MIKYIQIAGYLLPLQASSNFIGLEQISFVPNPKWKLFTRLIRIKIPFWRCTLFEDHLKATPFVFFLNAAVCSWSPKEGFQAAIFSGSKMLNVCDHCYVQDKMLHGSIPEIQCGSNGWPGPKGHKRHQHRLLAKLMNSIKLTNHNNQVVRSSYSLMVTSQ